LYASEADDLLNVIHKLSDKLERVMLFGHNPELTELAHRLSSEITHMPTCAVAELRSTRCRGQTSARPSSQKWRSTIQRNRRAKHRVTGDDAHFGATRWPTQRAWPCQGTASATQ